MFGVLCRADRVKEAPGSAETIDNKAINQLILFTSKASKVLKESSVFPFLRHYLFPLFRSVVSQPSHTLAIYVRVRITTI
jgi:hypothetical protein